MWPLVATLVASALAAASAAAQPVHPLVEQVQIHLDRVHDFEARFSQRYVRRMAGKVIEERGVVAVKKPGRMRWDYLTPEEKLFITDGTKSYFYVPEERQVFVSHLPSGALGSPESPLALLAGRSRLLDGFEVFPSPSQPRAGGVVLRLVPRRSLEDVEEVEIEVEPSNGRVLRVVLVDSQGNQTEFRFEDVRENVNLPDSLFLFTVPPGVEIVLSSERPSVPLSQESWKP